MPASFSALRQLNSFQVGIAVMVGPDSARQKKFFQSHSGLSQDPVRPELVEGSSKVFEPQSALAQNSVRSAPTPFAIECRNLVLRQAQDERNLNNFRGRDSRHVQTRLNNAKKFFQSHSGLSQDPVRPEPVEGPSKVFESQSSPAQNTVRSAPTPFVLSLSKDPLPANRPTRRLAQNVVLMPSGMAQFR